MLVKNLATTEVSCFETLANHIWHDSLNLRYQCRLNDYDQIVMQLLVNSHGIPL